VDRHCIKCDLAAKAAEIEQLRVELTAMTCSWKMAEAEIELLRKQLFAAQQAILREGMEVNRLREENKSLRMCPGAVEYSVIDPRDVT
jgi:hypothetical protein